MPKTEEITNFTFKMDRKTRNSFSMRDENGFTPVQAAELQKRIDEIEKGNAVRHDLIEE